MAAFRCIDIGHPASSLSENPLSGGLYATRITWCTVPDEHEFARDMSHKVLQKTNDVFLLPALVVRFLAQNSRYSPIFALELDNV